MASGLMLGAGLGAATSMATGQDLLKGAAIGGAMGGIGGAMSSAPTTGAAASQQFAQQGMVNPALTSGAAGTGAYSGATSMMTNPGLTETASSGMFGGVGDMASSAMDGFTDMTGMTGQDLGGMAFNKGMNALAQPDPQQQIQAAPMGQGISRPQVDLSKSAGSLLSSNPMTSGAGGRQMTQKDYELLKQGLL